MNWIVKFAGIGIVVFSTSAYGILLCREIRDRLTELKELKKIMFLLRGEIGFGRTPILEAADNISKRCNTIFQKAMKMLSENSGEIMEAPIEDIWKKTLEKVLPESHLSKFEKERLLQVGECLGLSDVSTQINAIDVYMDELVTSINELERSMPAKIKLYKSLGIMCGIVISIIIV